jgi:hypothetical protein
MALLGCDVVTTDQVEVLPLLMRNVERNKSWIAQSNPDSGFCFQREPAGVLLIEATLCYNNAYWLSTLCYSMCSFSGLLFLPRMDIPGDYRVYGM